MNAEEMQVFTRMVGSRYNTGRREVKLSTDRFPNRIENKKYLTHLIESLVTEAQALNAFRGEHEGADK